MAMVLFVGCVFSDSKGLLANIGSTFVLTLFLFVYGEMFPKHLCLQAPTKMLRLLSPVIISAFWLFLPVTAFLYLLNRVVSALFGKNNNLIRESLGRKELSGILDEGTKTGVLVDTQRRLADGIFQSSHLCISDIAAAPSSVPFVTADMKPDAVLDIMRQYNLTDLPVYDAGTHYPAHVLPTGFVRSIDLEIAARQQIDEQSRQLLQLLQTELPLRSTADIAGKHSLLTGLILLQTLHSGFGCVVDDRKHCIGFVNSDQICNALLRSETN
jgi:CBS domain containing-hemolysin-like protein